MFLDSDMKVLMNKIIIALLLTILPSASMAAGIDIGRVPWTEAHIKTLRAVGTSDVARFYLKQTDPEEFMTESDLEVFNFEWHPVGDGKYELAIGCATGPDISSLTVFWQDAPGRIRSQGFELSAQEGEEWYDDAPLWPDIDADGKTELVLLEGLDYKHPVTKAVFDRKFVPNTKCPEVYRLEGGQYMKASAAFPAFYDKTVLPRLDAAIAEKREEIKKRAGDKAKPSAAVPADPNDDYWQDPMRYLAALIMCKDNVMRLLGRDPNAGLTLARLWAKDSDPVMVDNARIVFEAIGGHDEEARSAMAATKLAIEKWPKKYYQYPSAEPSSPAPPQTVVSPR
jgi:hypothetical protein